MLRRLTRPARNRSASVSIAPCVAPEDVIGSPLLTELVAIRDHAVHLGWRAGREQRPAAYQELAMEVIGMVLEGWREQCPGGTLADLMPQGWDDGRSASAGDGA